ncbi:MAG: DedA family protein [Aquabacterium sp.]|jgi:membrane protein YqaA with SNARE-associated domain|uniref:YqaA family protein n=1 Tax=Aquabacterium sp. TaxID=1872578 RepID=UPI001B47454E|nr:YqaA family protein [Aquabacterium sp.]MBP7131807.1 DedA family protein [Aquabacterium sp.]MBP9064202.1 DedA family protein [Aquabacterium sp.]
MDSWMPPLIASTLGWLALPSVGLPAVFVVALLSATLLPMGSEPAVFALVQAQPELFWPAVLVATAGNTVGGAISWWMGAGAHRTLTQWQHSHPRASAPKGRGHEQALTWLARFGPKACLLAWLPVVGDPLCAVAGWLRLPFWPCVAYMAVGKLARYITMTGALVWAF